MSDGRPTLIQLDISHYSEKVRWALDYKQVPHVRRSPLPGSHIPIAFALTRGESVTLPLLQLDGRTIADSTAILAALEERYPDPPLYPADPEQRRRALELEDFFDEELGPHARLLPFHELTNEPAMFAEVAAAAVPGPLGKAKGLVGLYARTYTGLRFGVRDEAAAAAGAGEDRRRAGPARGRAGGERRAASSWSASSLSVADITAASLFYPVVGPDEGPLPADSPTPAGAGALPRRDRRPPRLPLGRRDVPPPPLSGAASRGAAPARKVAKKLQFADNRLRPISLCCKHGTHGMDRRAAGGAIRTESTVVSTRSTDASTRSTGRFEEVDRRSWSMRRSPRSTELRSVGPGALADQLAHRPLAASRDHRRA